MGTRPDKTESNARNMALMGIISGIIALMMFSDPSTCLLFGAIALILSLLSRYYLKHFSKMALASFILGIAGILLSLFVFFNFMMAIRIMDDPESIAASMDSASAEQFRAMINYYREILSGVTQ